MEYDEWGFVSATDGTRLFYGLRGAGSARLSADDPEQRSVAGSDVVLVDGIGCDGWAWRYLQPFFARRHRVVHWHYRGHGRSGAPQDRRRTDVPTLADDLRCVMDGLAVHRGIVVGHSMGCQVALEMYRKHPQRFKALILIAGSYGRVTETFHGSDLLAQWLPTIIETVEQHRGLVRALWGRVPHWLAFRVAKLMREIDGLNVGEQDFRQYTEHVASMSPDLFLEMLQHAGDHSAEDVLPTVTAPTLVVAGRQDTFTPHALARHMADAIPHAAYFELPTATHAAPVEQPEAIQQRIERFLSERLDEPV